jgi:hypothetical protein
MLKTGRENPSSALIGRVFMDSWPLVLSFSAAAVAVFVYSFLFAA